MTHKPTLAEKEQEGAYAIQTIEATVKQIQRKPGYYPQRAAIEMTRFAQGDSECYVQSQSSSEVLTIIKKMVSYLLKKTCLSTQDIHDLIVMINYI